MPRPTYKRQEEIKSAILDYLREDDGREKTWKELKEMARADKMSPTTLNRYLKDFQLKGLITRSADANTRPATITYSFLGLHPIQAAYTPYDVDSNLIGSRLQWKLWMEELDEKLNIKNRERAMKILADHFTKRLQKWSVEIAHINKEALRYDDPQQAKEAVHGQVDAVLGDIGKEAYILIRNRDIAEKAIDLATRKVLRVDPKKISFA